MPLVSQGNLLLSVSEALPFLTLALPPYSSFNLRKEKARPARTSRHENWGVGNFPNMGFFARKQIAARLFKAAGMIEAFALEALRATPRFAEGRRPCG